MSLTPQWLDELRSRLSLSSVIGRTTRVQKAGREFKACCPFHNEKTPSFTINDEKGFYHCFGCGAHGDVIRWMTDQRGLGFMDAVKELAAEAGMEVPELDPKAAKAAQQRDSLHDVMAAAQAWFVDRLASPDGEKARSYLNGRGLDAHTVQRFGFGYAPEGRQALKVALSRFPDAMLIEAGLRIAVDDKEPYDRFRGRLMLPIEDARGRVIAFGGRILDAAKTDAPKYLNSPDTPLFDKGRTLYNLHRAGPAARQSGRLVLVEGYIDAIALSAAGIGDCVAPLGTALTERQIEMAWRMVESPVLCFDGDAAGQRAAIRAIGRALPLLRPAHSLRIAHLPAGLDPDDLLRQQGLGAMEKLLGEARSLIDTLWLHERDAMPLETPEAKAGLKARLLAHVELITDNDIKGLYRRELLDRFSEWAYPRRQESYNQSGSAPKPRRTPPENASRLKRVAEGGAREALATAIIAGLIRYPNEIPHHAEAFVSTPGLDPRFDVLISAAESEANINADTLAALFQDRKLVMPTATEYANMPYPFVRDDSDPSLARAALAAAVAKLVEEPAIDAAIIAATERFDMAEQDRLRTRKKEISERLRQLSMRPSA